MRVRLLISGLLVASAVVASDVTPAFAQANSPTASAPGGVQLPPAMANAVNAGDLDAIAAFVTQVASSNAGNLGAVMQAVAQLNPNIAGALVNAAMRQITESGAVARSDVGSMLSVMVQSTVQGLSNTVDPTKMTAYAENLAVNVRQVVAVVSGGDANFQNTLLATARAAVAQAAPATSANPAAPGAQATQATQTSSTDQARQVLAGLISNVVQRMATAEVIGTQPIVIKDVPTNTPPANQNQNQNQNQNTEQKTEQKTLERIDIRTPPSSS